MVGGEPERVVSGVSGPSEAVRLDVLGREPELAAAQRALAGAVAGHGGLLLVSGEVGMGKTRLCEEIRVEARRMGMIDLLGRAYPGDRDLAFAPLSDALWAERRVPGSKVWARLGAHVQVLAAMAPALVQSTPAGEEAPPPLDLRGFVEGFLDVLDGVCEEATGLLWVIEDVHWADETTQRVIAYAARRLSRMRIVTLVTYCAQELGADHPWRRSVAELRTLENTTHLRLAPLAGAPARALACAALGTDPGGEVLDEIVRHSMGNPALVIEVARAGTTPVSSAAPPQAVRDVVQRRLAQLEPFPRHVISVVAVVGDDVSPQLMRLLCVADDNDITDVEDAVAELADLGLLRHVVNGDGERVRFAHPLFQDVVYAMLSARERCDLHAAAATALSQLADDHPHAVAHHWERAHRHDRALAVLTGAAEVARRNHRLGAAADLTRLAHDLLLRHAEPMSMRDDVNDRMLAEFAQLGRWAEALAFARDAWCRREGMPPVRRAVLAEVLGRSLLHNGAITEAGELLRDELEYAEREGVAGRARLLAAVAEQAIAHGDPRAATLLDDALAATRGEGDAEAEHRVADAITCLRFRSHRHRAAAAADHSLHLDDARRSGLVAAEALSLFRVAAMTTAPDDLRRAQACADRIAGEVAPVTALARALVFLFEGTTAAATDVLLAADSAIDDHFPWLSTGAETVRALACLQRGDLDGTAAALDRARATVHTGTLAADHALLHAATGWLEWERGDHAGAAMAFAASRELQRSGGVGPLDLGHVPLAWHVDALVREGRRDHAAAVLSEILEEDPHADRFTSASLAAARFRLELTPSSADVASAAALRAPWPLLALTVAAWRGSLLDDRSQAGTAARVGAELGMARAVARLEKEMRQAGRAGPAHRRRVGLAGLSPRELEIADLVSTGLSNPAIGRVLQVSERTVAVHVSHVLGKLGFTSRTQIARWVAEGTPQRQGSDR